MWLILGLFAALSATALIESSQTSSSGAGDDEAQPDESGSHAGDSEQEIYEDILRQLDDDAAETIAQSSEPDTGTETEIDVPGLFDELDERIHSIDDGPSEDLPTEDVDSPPVSTPLPPLMPENPDAGLFDELDERIHSSDADAPVEPPSGSLILGSADADRLVGGPGNDTLHGGAGNDTLIGAAGDDLLTVTSGDNHLIGGEGDDTLRGGAGNDTLEGGWGDDLLVAGGGDNLLMGGAGDDTLVGLQRDETGADISGANILNGGAGDDLLIAGRADTLHGGEGADQFILGDWLAGQEPAVILDYSAGSDQIIIYYDSAELGAPQVTVTFDDSTPEMAQLRLEGQIIAHVANAADLTAEEIRVVEGRPDYSGIAAE